MKLDGKTIIAILAFITSCGGGAKWLYGTGRETGELKAKIEFQKEHEKILDELIVFRLSCASAKQPIH